MIEEGHQDETDDVIQEDKDVHYIGNRTIIFRMYADGLHGAE